MNLTLRALGAAMRHTAIGTVLSERWQRITVAGAAATWLLGTTIVWAAGEPADLGGELLADAVGSVATAAGGLALAVLLLDPVRALLDKRRAQEERRAWLRTTFPLVLLVHDAVRQACASTAQELYRVVCSAGVIESPVPAATLRGDIARRPGAATDVGEDAADEADLVTPFAATVEKLREGAELVNRAAFTGPLRVVCLQVEEVGASFRELELEVARQAEARVIGGDGQLEPTRVSTGYRQVTDEVKIRLGIPQAERVAAAVRHGALDGVVARADWVVSLAGSAVGPREVDTAPLLHAALALSVAAHRAADCAADRTYTSFVETFGSTVCSESAVSRAAELMSVVSTTLNAVAATRDALRLLALDVLALGLDVDAPRAASLYFEQRRSDAAQVEQPQFRSVRIPEDDWVFTPASWDLWRRSHGMLLDNER